MAISKIFIATATKTTTIIITTTTTPLTITRTATTTTMFMRVIYLVYKWCWIISSDLHRQYARGDHSLLPAIFLFIIAMHDTHLVHETATLSIFDGIDFESHAIIDSPPHNHQHTTGTVSALILYRMIYRVAEEVDLSDAQLVFLQSI